jgi:hypothetical protein
MAQYHSELIFLVPWVVLFVIAVSMVIQGWMIIHESHGYRENPIVKGHPEMKGFKKGDGLLVVKFTEEDLQELQRRVLQQKIDELFEEPSTYEDEDDDD